MRTAITAALLLSVSGCGWHAPMAFDGTAGAALGSMIENPIAVPVTDPEFVWNQIVDEIDNYFKIEREDRVRMVGNVLTEGRIDTFPVIGSTYLEPWRRDSTVGFEKLQSTLQTIRRRAQVRVIPTVGGYEIEVAVFKELEDLERPEQSTVGGSIGRHDTSLDRNLDRLTSGRNTLGWIPLCRDIALEQRILANLRGRLTELLPLQATQPIAPNTGVNTPLSSP